eukprot:351323-Chlamydomonas_euryale.AAC.4
MGWAAQQRCGPVHTRKQCMAQPRVMPYAAAHTCMHACATHAFHARLTRISLNAANAHHVARSTTCKVGCGCCMPNDGQPS